MDGLEEGCGQEDVGRREGRREMEEWSLLNSSWALVGEDDDDDEYEGVGKTTPAQGEEVQAPQKLEEWQSQAKPSGDPAHINIFYKKLLESGSHYSGTRKRAGKTQSA